MLKPSYPRLAPSIDAIAGIIRKQFSPIDEKEIFEPLIETSKAID